MLLLEEMSVSTVLCDATNNRCLKWLTKFCLVTLPPVWSRVLQRACLCVYVCLSKCLQAYQFSVSFLLAESFLLLYCLVLLSLVFSMKPRDWLGGTFPIWPILCWVGCKIIIDAVANVDSYISSHHTSTVVQHRRPAVHCQCLHTSALRRSCDVNPACCGDRDPAISLRMLWPCPSSKHFIDLVLTMSAVFRRQVCNTHFTDMILTLILTADILCYLLFVCMWSLISIDGLYSFFSSIDEMYNVSLQQWITVVHIELKWSDGLRCH